MFSGEVVFAFYMKRPQKGKIKTTLLTGGFPMERLITVERLQGLCRISAAGGVQYWHSAEVLPRPADFYGLAGGTPGDKGTGEGVEGRAAGAGICRSDNQLHAGRSTPLFDPDRVDRLPGEISEDPKTAVSG